MTQPAFPTAPIHTVEHGPFSTEGQPDELLKAFLLDRSILAGATSGVPAVDYVRDTLAEADVRGLRMTRSSLDELLLEAFGAPEDARARLEELGSAAKEHFGDLLPVLVRYAERPGERKDRIARQAGIIALRY